MADYREYLEGLKHKDEDAFAYIYHETKHAVFMIINSIVKNRFVSEDLMQDTYITMLEKINQYQPHKNFLTWLLTIARNKAIDYYRRHQKEVFLDVCDDEYLLTKTELESEKTLMVQEMLSKLSDVEQRVFLLNVLNQIKCKDIAKILGLPLGTVLWHMSNAKKKIKKYQGGVDDEISR